MTLIRNVNLQKKININAGRKCQICQQIHYLCSKYVKLSSQITVGSKSSKLIVNVISRTGQIYTVEEIRTLLTFFGTEYD